MIESTTMDEHELLEAYAQTESEAVFQQLVERHIHLVFSAAFRQTRNRQLAEDVTQAVFILLAKKARRISKAAPLAGWLFRAAHLAAIQVVRNESRRKRREQAAVEWPVVPPPIEPWLGHPVLSFTSNPRLICRFGGGS
jgi:DNA-directed RNA polymerase specialized sigma24 family protein